MRATQLLFRLIVGLLMAVAWIDRTLRVPLPFPRDPKQLLRRRRWCIGVLTKAGLLRRGSQVLEFAVAPFKTGEAFRSQCARVDLRVANPDGSEVRHALVAKFAPPPNNLRDHAIFILQENHKKEAGVYQHLAGDPHIAMPAAYFAAAHGPSGNLCLLIERMEGGREVSERQGCPPELCELAVDAFASLHAAFWDRSDPRTDFLAVVPDSAIDFLAELFQGPDRALFGELLRQVWRHDKQAPTTVLHGDARVGNMLFPGSDGSGRFALIDWQAARKGKGAFDLAYFLVLSCDPTVRRAHAERLLDRYHAALLANGVQGYGRETLGDDYRFACLLTLAFVSLPLLSAESSATDANAKGLADLGEVWAQRMAALVQDLDFAWIQAKTGLDAGQLQTAFARSNRRVAEQTAPQ
ncbi:MAG: phosphotransferase [Deltaproteobacteria bacterium]|nr:phosphotransferase [Deltaproteobacteria bacterium]